MRRNRKRKLIPLPGHRTPFSAAVSNAVRPSGTPSLFVKAVPIHFTGERTDSRGAMWGMAFFLGLFDLRDRDVDVQSIAPICEKIHIKSVRAPLLSRRLCVIGREVSDRRLSSASDRTSPATVSSRCREQEEFGSFCMDSLSLRKDSVRRRRMRNETASLFPVELRKVMPMIRMHATAPFVTFGSRSVGAVREVVRREGVVIRVGFYIPARRSLDVEKES